MIQGRRRVKGAVGTLAPAEWNMNVETGKIVAMGETLHSRLKQFRIGKSDGCLNA